MKNPWFVIRQELSAQLKHIESLRHVGSKSTLDKLNPSNAKALYPQKENNFQKKAKKRKLGTPYAFRVAVEKTKTVNHQIIKQ